MDGWMLNDNQTFYLSIYVTIYLSNILSTTTDTSSTLQLTFFSSNYCYYYYYFYCCICGLLQSLTGHGLSIQGITLPKIEILAELDILHSIAQKP